MVIVPSCSMSEKNNFRFPLPMTVSVEPWLRVPGRNDAGGLWV